MGVYVCVHMHLNMYVWFTDENIWTYLFVHVG